MESLLMTLHEESVGALCGLATVGGLVMIM